MKTGFFVLFYFSFCLSNDSVDRQRILLHNSYDLHIKEYLSDKTWSALRCIPFTGQVMDCITNSYLKMRYHKLFESEVRNQQQWNDYISRLQENEKNLNKLLKNCFLRLVIDFFIVASFGGTTIYLLDYHQNDYFLHNFVYMYAVSTLVRSFGCGLLAWETYRIKQNNIHNPRLLNVHNALEAGSEAVADPAI